MISNIRHAIGYFFHHYDLGDNYITIVTILLFDDLCGQIVLIKAVFDTFDCFFFHDYVFIRLFLYEFADS